MESSFLFRAFPLAIVVLVLVSTTVAQSCDPYKHSAHATNCSLYVACHADGTRITQQCSVGVFFNDMMGWCDYQWLLPGCRGSNGEVSVSDPCSRSDCVSPKRCIVTNTNQKRYLCDCDNGMTGPNCDQDINECDADSNPCNQGQCMNTIGSFTCNCVGSGYYGMRCDRPEVSNSRCQNDSCSGNGICVSTGNSFSCTCYQGFIGARCETGNACASNPCLNSGNCRNGAGGSFSCDCAPGFMGTVCQTQNCENNPCGDNGQCFDNAGTAEYRCTCFAGFSGRNCQESTGTVCSRNPNFCGERRVCVPNAATSAGYVCNCIPGFTGPFCNQDINECQLSTRNPCNNAGTCMNTIGSFSCWCRPQFTGPTCNSTLTCSDNPCINGICVMNSNFFSCNCQGTSFSGVFCQNRIQGRNTCINHLCQNGRCVDRQNGYTCECNAPYTGTYCDEISPGCQNNPCRNGGTCSQDANGFVSCICQPGFSGNLCSARE